ncbi:class I SAM-dependent methyltransferase [Aliiroseovarius subalbicans]|uniref:class I SAM-dependent methyltransferase n=1 Tax=Aliiroseovarius subalbicans TaxID=2925840 RepID=UPI001F55F5A5|nr:class I SAM-dependent methyltransferase [Aliiroseovarius subalbicans]MCI2398519.1 class I SAM-dependent methyltransferase [Aliiroseovarius subalbicans]
MDNLPDDWRAANLASWNERVALHLKADAYDMTPLREGRGRLHPIEQGEIGDVRGLKIAHLQCHFGRDSLILAQQGAEVVGLDFSGDAIQAARELARELGLEDRASFVEADLFDAPTALAGYGPFDLVFVTWGAIGWLPDIKSWAAVVAGLLHPGGKLYLAEGHPSALVFDDETTGEGALPNYFVPYFQRTPFVDDAPSDYTGDFPALEASHEYWWDHTMADILNALIGAGMRLDFLNEHDAIPWRMFQMLTSRGDGLYGWPDKAWLPLGFSLGATRKNPAP